MKVACPETLNIDQTAFLETDFSKWLQDHGLRFFVGDETSFFPGFSDSDISETDTETTIIFLFPNAKEETPIAIHESVIPTLVCGSGSVTKVPGRYSLEHIAQMPLHYLAWLLLETAIDELHGVVDDQILDLATVLSDELFVDDMLDVAPEDLKNQLLARVKAS